MSAEQGQAYRNPQAATAAGSGYDLPTYEFRVPPELGGERTLRRARGRGRLLSADHRRRRTGRPCGGLRLRGPRHPGHRPRRGQHHRRARRLVAWHLLCAAHARDPEAARRIRARAAEGRAVVRGPHACRRRRGLQLQPRHPANPQLFQPAGLHQYPAVLHRVVPGGPHHGARHGRSALAEPGNRHQARRRRRRSSPCTPRPATTSRAGAMSSMPPASAVRCATCSACRRAPKWGSTAGASPTCASGTSRRSSAGPGSRRRSTRTARSGST